MFPVNKCLAKECNILLRSQWPTSIFIRNSADDRKTRVECDSTWITLVTCGTYFGVPEIYIYISIIILLYTPFVNDWAVLFKYQLPWHKYLAFIYKLWAYPRPFGVNYLSYNWFDLPIEDNIVHDSLLFTLCYCKGFDAEMLFERIMYCALMLVT